MIRLVDLGSITKNQFETISNRFRITEQEDKKLGSNLVEVKRRESIATIQDRLLGENDCWLLQKVDNQLRGYEPLDLVFEYLDFSGETISLKYPIQEGLSMGVVQLMFLTSESFVNTLIQSEQVSDSFTVQSLDRTSHKSVKEYTYQISVRQFRSSHFLISEPI